MLPETLQNVLVGMLINCWVWRNKFLMNNNLKFKKDHQYAPNAGPGMPSLLQTRTGQAYTKTPAVWFLCHTNLTQVSFPVTTLDRKFCLFLTSSNRAWHINTCYNFCMSMSNQPQTLHIQVLPLNLVPCSIQGI